MTAVTHQRAENIQEIKRLALEVYDAKSAEEKRKMFEAYVSGLAHLYSVKNQRDWIKILTAAQNEMK